MSHLWQRRNIDGTVSGPVVALQLVGGPSTAAGSNQGDQFIRSITGHTLNGYF